MKIAVIGTGAVGGYYGALLQRAGNELHFLLRSDYEHVREHGLLVESPNGDFRLENVHAWRRAEEMPECDLVLVALKTTANRFLPELLAPAGEKGIVLTLQNGLGCEEDVAAVVGPDRVLGGLCFLCSHKVGPGHIRHLDYGRVTIGEYRADGRPAGITPRLREVAELFETAGVPVHPTEDLPLARWKKLIWNIPFNGLSVVLDRRTDEILADPESRARVRRLMEEVAAASAACARPIEPAFIDRMIADTERMTPYAPSMKLDFDRGRPLELEHLYLRPLRAAEAAGVAMPETRRLFEELCRIAPPGSLPSS